MYQMNAECMFMLDDKENVTEERKMQIVWG